MASENDMIDTIGSNSGQSAPDVSPVFAPPVSRKPKASRWAHGESFARESKDPFDVGETPRASNRWYEDSRISACLVSTILHTILFIILALFTYGASLVTTSMISLEGRTGETIETVTLEIVPNDQQDIELNTDAVDQPVDINLLDAQATQTMASSVIQQQDTPAEDPSEFGQLALGATVSKKTHSQRVATGGGLSGRTPEMRVELGRKYGSSAASDAALEMALQWLADHQRPNGSWSFNLDLDPCNGRCRHSKKTKDTPTPVTASTGLALLAFLGAGHTHKSGKYATTVRDGLYYLRAKARETEQGYDFQHGSMYGHGIAVMALGEALTMTREDGKYESDLFSMVQRASYFTVAAQHDNGSWGYVPGSPGDTTQTGWQTLSLIATRRNGIQLPTNTLPKVKEYLLSVRDPNNWSFGYRTPKAEPTTTAIAATLMLYLGQSPGYTPLDDALDGIAQRGPTLTNVYHDYYGTLALHHARHRDWDKWNTKLRDHLVATQATEGHERGSWHFKNKWGDIGGRLYTTAMCAMMLEIYYRYLPLYDGIEDFPL